ncbi:jg9180, partial [Pararge aegeria aegeria]
ILWRVGHAHIDKRVGGALSTQTGTQTGAKAGNEDRLLRQPARQLVQLRPDECIHGKGMRSVEETRVK